MTEIHEYNMALRSVGRETEAKPVSVVLSLGTGMVPVSELKEIDVFRPDSLFDAAKLAYGISAIGALDVWRDSAGGRGFLLIIVPVCDSSICRQFAGGPGDRLGWARR